MKDSLWICGRVLRTSQRPAGRVDKPWITKRCYPWLVHTRWLRAHIPTGSIIIVSFFSVVVSRALHSRRLFDKILGMELEVNIPS